jgi:Family of unknown function (DUF5678)
MRVPSFEELIPYENKWVALSKPSQSVVGSGKDVSEAKRDAESNGFTDVMFLKVYPSNMGYLPTSNEV